jgi:hypothetical protein
LDTSRYTAAIEKLLPEDGEVSHSFYATSTINAQSVLVVVLYEFGSCHRAVYGDGRKLLAVILVYCRLSAQGKSCVLC